MIERNNDYLKALEAESVYILREAMSEFNNSYLLFSGGKDSIVLAHLAKKAFWPSKIPFKFLHIDTGHNFKETIIFRDQFIEKMGVDLLVKYVEDSVKEGIASEEKGVIPSRNAIQSVTLMSAIDNLSIDCCIAGARRDEEKSRAKERFFSHRDEFGSWLPKNQRPELWNIFSGKKFENEHFRVFPLSNWTELDIWNYISQEEITVPSLYFSHEREVFEYNGIFLATNEFVDSSQFNCLKKFVRFRTIGDMTCTGAVESKGVKTVTDVIEDLKETRISERGSRGDDLRSDTAMEDRKRVGYF